MRVALRVACWTRAARELAGPMGLLRVLRIARLHRRLAAMVGMPMAPVVLTPRVVRVSVRVVVMVAVTAHRTSSSSGARMHLTHLAQRAIFIPRKSATG